MSDLASAENLLLVYGQRKTAPKRKTSGGQTEVKSKRSFCSHLYPYGINRAQFLVPEPPKKVKSVDPGPVKEITDDPKPEAVTQMANKLCVICYTRLLDEVEDENPEGIETTPCGHHFHSKCYKKWTVLSETCPLCRKNTWLIYIANKNLFWFLTVSE